MIISLLLIVPLVLAGLAFSGKISRAPQFILLPGAVVQAVLCGILLNCQSQLNIGEVLTLRPDNNGLVILVVTGVLFLLTSCYICFWLPQDARQIAEHGSKPSMSEPVLCGLLLLFLLTMNLTALAQDFGMLWVAVEATTLASAPLINFHKGKGSLEAMWKYLLICSTGIGLALFGTMMVAASLNDPETGLSFRALAFAAQSGGINIQWFKAGFVFCLAGYALKMGLAPFHTWLPDAHSEAPAPVSALLSGSLLNCALLAVIRLLEITPAEVYGFCCNYLKFFGFLSLITAAFFIIRQKDFKRMLAYSSVEHMGIIALLLAYGLHSGALLHVIGHSLTKMALFLIAGNILLIYGSRSIAKVRGLMNVMPRSGALWIIGMLLICGTPPSPLFFTEIILVRQAGLAAGGVILLLLLMVFCGMSYNVFKMCEMPEKSELPLAKEPLKLMLIPCFAMVMVMLIGIAVGAMWITAR